ncbi:hypothetical protein [Nocardia sp. NPDC056564]|uniref:hypothetical protein n=1 Tax=Nocardia sp. NPDC056564 TaxID=3345865 RepID=UPI00366F2B6C
MKLGLRGLMSLVTVAATCMGVGFSATPAYAAATPWGSNCSGDKASQAEKALVIQACQRAYGAANRTSIAAPGDKRFRQRADAAATRAADATTAADAASAAADAAKQAALIITTGVTGDKGPGWRAIAELANRAKFAAQRAAKNPTDVKLANKAAEAETAASQSLPDNLGDGAAWQVAVPEPFTIDQI